MGNFETVNGLKDIKAVIFDCDGVLVDSEIYSCMALRETIIEETGEDIGEDYDDVIGMSIKDTLTHFREKGVLRKDIQNLEEFHQKKAKRYFVLAEAKLTTFPHLLELLNFLKKEGVKLAICSSGSIEKINFSLESVKISKFFNQSQITSGTEVEVGKPHPDIYKLAVQRLGVRADTCLVIEDSFPGVQSALNAGTKVIGFPSTFKTFPYEDPNFVALPSPDFIHVIKLLSE